MLDFIISAVTNGLRIYLIYRFLSVFFGRAEDKRGRVFCACGFFYVVNLMLFWSFHTAWINVVCNLLGIGVIVRQYTKSVKTNLFVTGAVYLVNMGCDVVGTLPFIQYEDGRNFSQVYEVITVLLILVCLLLAEKIITVHRNAEQTSNVSLAVVPLCGIAVIYFLVSSGACGEMGIAVTALGLLVINFFMLSLYNQLLYSVTRKYETELLKQQVRIYANQLEVLLQGEEKVKALRHDLKHHLKELKLLARQYHAEKISDYIDRMEDFARTPGETISSGNVEIDSVLNYMLQKAGEELKVVKTKVILPEKITHSFEMNVLLGNLLENAIEAAGRSKEGYLYVGIVWDRGALRIRIDNSYAEGSVVRGESGNGGGTFYTTKEEKHKHGIGLRNVKRIVESYNGNMEIQAKDGIFSVKLVLYIPEGQS